jgi:hypothetical protein
MAVNMKSKEEARAAAKQNEPVRKEDVRDTPGFGRRELFALSLPMVLEGPGFTRSPDPGGPPVGEIKSVSATAPITSSGGATPIIGISEATDAASGSMSAADKMKLDSLPGTDLWSYDSPIPASASNPELRQAQAASDGGTVMRMRSQAAAPGSGQVGGDMSFILGQDDAPFSTVRNFWWGIELAPGAVEPVTDYFGYGVLKLLPGHVVALTLGGGSNGIGGDVAGVEISSYSQMGFATENASTINFTPCDGATHAGIIFSSNAGLPGIALLDTDLTTTAQSGLIRLPWGLSKSDQEILDQRNSDNTADLPIISRIENELHFGSYSESNHFRAFDQVQFELNNTGDGWVFSTPNGQVGALRSDVNRTWVQGDPDTGHDGVITNLYSLDTTSNQLQTIVAITLQDGTFTVTQLAVNITGVDQVTGQFCTFRHEWAFVQTSEEIMAAAGDQPAATDTGHSAAATGVAPQFAISGSAINVTVTPWTSNKIHWCTSVRQVVNSGVF